MRVVLFGSPPFATGVLERLLASRHQVAAVATLPDKPRGRGQKVEPSPLVDLARARGVRVLQPARPHDEAFLAELRALAPQCLCVASYGVILKPALLELAPQGALNVHASLLPRHRGASPIQAAILAGDAETGVAIQRMVLALDEGDVIAERRTPIGGEETAGALSARLSELGGDALIEALDALEGGRARFTPQDGANATYARKIKKEHGWVDWSRPAQDLERTVRAFHPWPLARTRDPRGRELALLRASAREGAGEAGAILAAGERFVIACGRDALEIHELVPAGKKPLAGAEFLRGARLAPGERMQSGPPAP